MIQQTVPILDALTVFKQGGPWITLAKELAIARDRGDNLNIIDLPLFKTKRLIAAYRFLEIQRPDVLNLPPEQVIADYRAISGLPNLYSRLPKETRDQEILDCLDKVLRKEISAYALESQATALAKIDKIGKQLVKKEQKPTMPLDQEEIQVLGKGLTFFKGLLDTTIRKFGYDAINKHYSEICDEIAVTLNCIADPGFRKSWEEREEIVL